MDSNETLQQWLHKGGDDLRSAEYLFTMRYPTPDEVICNFCQQPGVYMKLAGNYGF